MREYLYDELKVGMCESFQKKITNKEIGEFSNLTGDYNPLHINENYAKKTQFGKKVSFGMLSASFLSALVGMYLPGKYALILSCDIKFKNPCFEEDTLNISGIIDRKIDSQKMIIIKVSVQNQLKESILEGQMYVKVLK